jgi:hypothetical protein
MNRNKLNNYFKERKYNMSKKSELYSIITDIRFENGLTDGGLHCGETMDVWFNGKWIPTHIEIYNDWFLVGVKAESLEGMTVRKE